LFYSVKEKNLIIGQNVKIYILLGHPDSESFNGRIFQTYLSKALQYGHEVRHQQIG